MTAYVLARQQDWWLLVLRGVAAIFFGIAAFVLPGLTLAALVLLFGAYAIVDGIASLIGAFRRREPGQWEWHLIQGLLGLAAGSIAILLPGIAALALVALVAAWAVLTGASEIVLALRMKDRLAAEVLWFLAGIVSILLGLALIVFPAAGALAVTWLIGAYAIFLGVVFVTLGITVRAAVRTTAV
jgi:uncharacterized membrane protein HdeD (DUF308 family)